MQGLSIRTVKQMTSVLIGLQGDDWRFESAICKIFVFVTFASFLNKQTEFKGTVEKKYNCSEEEMRITSYPGAV